MKHVDPDIQRAVNDTGFTKCVVLVSKGREKSQHERLQSVRLEAVETTTAGNTLDEIFHLRYTTW